MPDLLDFPCITSTRIYKNRGSKHFVIYLNFFCLSLFTVWFCLCRIFSWLVVRDFCRSGFRYNFANSLSIYPAPSLFSLFPSLPRSLSLTQATVIWNQCLKLVSVPQRLAVVYISLFVTLSREKFPGGYHTKLSDGTYIYDSQSGLHRPMSSRILVSFDYQSPWSALKQKGMILLAFPGWQQSFASKTRL